MFASLAVKCVAECAGKPNFNLGDLLAAEAHKHSVALGRKMSSQQITADSNSNSGPLETGPYCTQQWAAGAQMTQVAGIHHPLAKCESFPILVMLQMFCLAQGARNDVADLLIGLCLVFMPHDATCRFGFGMPPHVRLRTGRLCSALRDLGYSCGDVGLGRFFGLWEKEQISRCRVFVPIYTDGFREVMMKAVKFAMEQQKRILPVWLSGDIPLVARYKHGLPRVPRGDLPLLRRNCDIVKELDAVLTKVFKPECPFAFLFKPRFQVQNARDEERQCNKQPSGNLSQASPSEEVKDEEEAETEDEDDDREMLESTDDRTSSIPSPLSHSLCPLPLPSLPSLSSQLSLSSRTSSAAAELPIAIKDQRLKKTVSFSDMQEEEECGIGDEEGVCESGGEDGVWESGDEDDDREMPDAEETAPTRSNPSLSSHRSSPSTPPLLSSRPSPAAAELPTTSKDQKVKKTVPFFNVQPQGHGRKLQLRSLATQEQKKKHQRLLPLQGQRNKQPSGNLLQASPSEEVATKVPAPSNAPGRRPAVPAAAQEEDRYNEAGGPKPEEPASAPCEAGTAALTGTCPAALRPAAPLLAKPAVKAKPAVQVKVQDVKTSGGGEKAVKDKDGPLPIAAAALLAEPAMKQAKPAVEVKVQNSAASSSEEKAGKAKDSPDPAPAQLMLSYRVKETGSKAQGGDGIVLRLQAALEAQGFSVFVGESDIEGGDSWTQAIQRAIDGCAIFIPVCSATYGAGGWTYKEVGYAVNKHKAIIPIWHSSTYPHPKVDLMMSDLQRVPRGRLPLVECDFDEVVTELVSCIRKKLAPGGLV
ncbi:hypothetical protein QJQ45_027125 [Haematococcus lacustris]|nr:hypothetical protein QJQ45_027125 [Haematococcus lacustris]